MVQDSAAPVRVKDKAREAEVKAGAVRVVRGLHSRAMTTADSTLSRLVPEAAALAVLDRAALADLEVREVPARTSMRC